MDLLHFCGFPDAVLALDLLTGLLKFDPVKRLSVEQSLDHEFFAEVRVRNAEVFTRLFVKLSFERFMALGLLQAISACMSFSPCLYLCPVWYSTGNTRNQILAVGLDCPNAKRVDT